MLLDVYFSVLPDGLFYVATNITCGMGRGRKEEDLILHGECVEGLPMCLIKGIAGMEG